jgi:hypothetical protein
LALTAGTDSSPQENYVYVLESAPTTLAKSTSDWPSETHIKIAFFLVPSATAVQSDGVLINQNWNDGTKDGETGHMVHLAENMRLTMGGSVYHSGVDGNGSDDFIDITINGGANDNVDFKTTAGVSYQMHKHTIPAIDMGAGDDCHVVNWNADAYHEVSDLNEITADASGVSITNKYFNVVFWVANNKTGEYSPLFANLPTSSYATLTNATNDTNGYDVYDIPKAFNRESSTGMLICRVTFRYTAAASGTWVVHNTTDLRGRTPGTASGTSLASQVEFPDNTFRIFDEADDTKQIAFDVGTNVGAGQTRTIIARNAEMTLMKTSEKVDLTDGGDTVLHNHAELDYSGTLVFQTAGDGIIVRDSSGSDPVLTMKSDAAVNQVRLVGSVTNGRLELYTGAAWEQSIKAYHNGAVELYYDNAKSFETAADGANLYDTSGNNTVLRFKTSANVLQGLITSNPTTMTYQMYNGASWEDTITANLNGAVELYYDDVKAFETVSGGINVYDADASDYGEVIHDGTNLDIKNETVSGHVVILGEDSGSAETTMALFDPDSYVGLYYDGINVFRTTAEGCDIFDSSGDDPILYLKEDDGTQAVKITSASASNVYIQSLRDGGDIWLSADDSGSTTRWTGIDSAKPSFEPSPDNSLSLGASGARWTELWAASATIQTSSIATKILKGSPLGMQFIDKLNPQIYQRITGSRDHWGFVAEDIKATIDELGVDFGIYVDPHYNGEDLKEIDQNGNPVEHPVALRYEELLSPIVKGLQELHDMIKLAAQGHQNQKQQIEDLEARLSALENK